MKLSLSLSHQDCLTSVYSAKQVLENEAKVAQHQGIEMFSLMCKAGQAAFKQLTLIWPAAKHILVVCGKGNNGGDGFIVAKLAKQSGLAVKVILLCDEQALSGDALRAFELMKQAAVPYSFEMSNQKTVDTIQSFQGDVIVDAIFGIGFHGDLPNTLRPVISVINHSTASVLSIDVPSGLCASTGSVSGDELAEQAVIADHCVTFIVLKQGLFTGQAGNFVGTITLAELNLGDAFKGQVVSKHSIQAIPAEQKLAKTYLPRRLNTSHKGNIGLLLAVGGNVGMPGAIRLASEAALRSGAGLLSVCCHHQNSALVFSGRAELMIAANSAEQLTQAKQLSKAKACLIGPGLGQDDWAMKLCKLVFDDCNLKSKPLVIDADALNFLANLPKNAQHINSAILTPHPKEASSLLGCDVADIEKDRFSAVKQIANKYGGICLLKGAGTLISDGENVVINTTGNPGMASGGMGDVLSGIIGALSMQIEDKFYATCIASYLHGMAADNIAKKHGQRGMLASDLFVEIQQLVNE